jgi:hypothetical protein
VQHEQASGTALLIVGSLVLLHYDAKYSRLFPRLRQIYSLTSWRSIHANTSVRENCSADLVSVLREVDRAYHDPGDSAALRIPKEPVVFFTTVTVAALVIHWLMIKSPNPYVRCQALRASVVEGMVSS